MRLGHAVQYLAVIPVFGVPLSSRANARKSHLPYTYLCVDICISLSRGAMT